MDVLEGRAGIKTVLRDVPYEQIWDAAERVTRKHFRIVRYAPGSGVIAAERCADNWSWGEWLSIHITPPSSGAPEYQIEVVAVRKFEKQFFGRDWEAQVSHDILSSLGDPRKP